MVWSGRHLNDFHDLLAATHNHIHKKKFLMLYELLQSIVIIICSIIVYFAVGNNVRKHAVSNFAAKNSNNVSDVLF